VTFIRDTSLGHSMKFHRFLALSGLLAATAWAGTEVPANTTDKPRTGIVWGVMDAQDLAAVRVKSSRPAITFETEYVGRHKSENAATIERMRARMAERQSQDSVAQSAER
jgi:hypothetical protein